MNQLSLATQTVQLVMVIRATHCKPNGKPKHSAIRCRKCAILHRTKVDDMLTFLREVERALS